MAGSRIFNRVAISPPSDGEEEQEVHVKELDPAPRRGDPAAPRGGGANPGDGEDHIPGLHELLASLDVNDEEEVLSEPEGEQPSGTLDGMWRNSDGDVCHVAQGLCRFSSGRTRPIVAQNGRWTLQKWTAVDISDRRILWEKNGSSMEWSRLDDLQSLEPETSGKGGTPSAANAATVALPANGAQHVVQQKLVGDQTAPTSAPETDAVVSILTLAVRDADVAECNGLFKYDTTHKGKPLFKNAHGAIVYFQELWKMNRCYKTTGWVYSGAAAKGPLPPQGRWTTVGSNGATARTAPDLLILGEQLRVLGEKGPTVKLEAGRSVSKREENKSWCWGAPYPSEDQRQVAAAKAAAAAAEARQRNLPPRRTLQEVREAEERRKRQYLPEYRTFEGAGAASAATPSVNELLAQLDSEAAAADQEEVEGIDLVLAGLDRDEQKEQSEVAREVFFELGVPSPAVTQASISPGGVVTGRGTQYNFTALREMGAQMVQNLAAAEDPRVEQRRQQALTQDPEESRMSQLTRRLQALEPGSGRLMLRDRDASVRQDAATLRRVPRRP